MPLEAAIAYGAADAVMPYGSAGPVLPRRDGGTAAAPVRPAPEPAVAPPPVAAAVPVAPPAAVDPLPAFILTPPPAAPAPPPVPVPAAPVPPLAAAPVPVPDGPAEGTQGSFRHLTARLRHAPSPEPPRSPAPAPMRASVPMAPPVAAAPVPPVVSQPRPAVSPEPPAPAAATLRREPPPPQAPPPAAPEVKPADPPAGGSPFLVIVTPHPSYVQPEPPPVFVLVSPPPAPAWRSRAPAPAAAEPLAEVAAPVAPPAPEPAAVSAPVAPPAIEPDPEPVAAAVPEPLPEPPAQAAPAPLPPHLTLAPQPEPDPEPEPVPAAVPEFRPVAVEPAPAVIPFQFVVHEPPPEPEAAPSSLRTGSGEMAAALLDIVWGALDLAPQERALAGDALLLLMPALATRDLVMLAERVSVMDQPPPLLLSRLARDPHTEVAGVVLERAARLGDEDLIAAAAFADPDRLRLIARRRSLSPLVCDHLVSSGDLLTVLALLRNDGAEISQTSFLRLAHMASEHASLRAPLAMRPDLSVAVALALFWALPPELRRVIVSRFLLDTVRLGRLLALTGRGDQQPSALAVDTAVNSLLLGGNAAAAAGRFAELAGVSRETVLRILADPHGEPMVALFKALGLGRARFEDAYEKLRSGKSLLRAHRAPEELKAMFDSLSFNKARVLLLYWDWHTRQVGPYAATAGAEGAGLVERPALA